MADETVTAFDSDGNPVTSEGRKIGPGEAWPHQARGIREVPLEEIQEGDEFLSSDSHQVVWRALENARKVPVSGEDYPYEVHLNVQHFPDGGCSTRQWQNPQGITLPIRRGEPNAHLARSFNAA